MTVQYPDTRLREDQLDADYGGRPSAEFGGPAWAWVNGVLIYLERAFLTYSRVPWTTVVAVSTQAAQAGSVALFAPGVFAPSRGYVVRPYDAGLVGPRVLGLYLEPASAGARARIAVAGIVPPTVTGLAERASPADVTLDTATGRLKVASPGDTVLGRVDLQGNVFFTGYGSTL